MPKPLIGSSGKRIARSIIQGLRKQHWLLSVMALVGSVCIPFLLTEIPPVVDYPNHLARGFLLAFSQQDPQLSHVYTPHWSIIPNLALDLMLPPLLHVVPLHVAGRLVLAASLLFPLCGVLVYSRAIFHRWALWPLASALVAFNGAFLLGLMNFLFSAGAAFLTAAFWVEWRERAPVAAVLLASTGAIVVFFCHVVGVSVLGVLVAAHEIDRLGSPGRFDATRFVARILPAGAVFVVPLALYAISPAAAGRGPTFWLPWAAKPLLLMAPLMTYDFRFDLGSAGFLGLVIGVALWRGWLVMSRQGTIALALMLVAYLAAPFRLGGGTFLDFRFAAIIGYLLFGIMQESQAAPTWAQAGLFGSLFILFCGRLILLAGVWQAQTGEVAEMQAALRSVPPGSRVLIVSVTAQDAPDYWRAAPYVRSIDGIIIANVHLPVILLVQGRALPQTLFSDPAQQPIDVLPSYRESTALQAGWGVPDYSLLTRPLSPAEQEMFPYLASWRSKFDYVAAVNAAGISDAASFLPHHLELLRLTGVVAVFRVRHEVSLSSDKRQ